MRQGLGVLVIRRRHFSTENKFRRTDERIVFGNRVRKRKASRSRAAGWGPGPSIHEKTLLLQQGTPETRRAAVPYLVVPPIPRRPSTVVELFDIAFTAEKMC